MNCENCGAELKDGNLFCPKCGSEIKNNQTTKYNKKTSKGKIIIALVCCVAILITGTIGGLYFKNRNNGTFDNNENYIALETGFTDVKITDEESALQAIESVANVIGFSNVREELEINCVNTINSIKYYRFNQIFNSIPIYGKSLTIAVDDNENALALTSNYSSINDISNNDDKVTQGVVDKSVKQFISEPIISIEEIDSRKLIYLLNEDAYALAYKVLVLSEKDCYTFFIDVSNGEILRFEKRFNNNSSEVISKDGSYKAIGWKNGDGSYHLYNDEHKISIFDFSQLPVSNHSDWDFKNYGIDTMYSSTNVFGEKGVKLMDYLCQMDDYYHSIGDDGFDQINAAINDKVGTNASADGAYLFIDGKWVRKGGLFVGEDRNIDDVDIIGHEFTHMVSKSINRWNGIEGSALNEAYSDIFGEIIENDIKGSCDWKHDGRNLADPENKKNAQRYPASIEYLDNAKMHKDDYYINRNETSDYSHFASTIVSHCAYLMNTGIDGSDEKKIDLNLLGQLWYHALYLMQPNISFDQFRCAIELESRIMLNNNKLTSKQYKCVQEAFDTVGIDKESYTYKQTVKNDFTLKVINSLGTDDVIYDYKIYNVANINFVSEDFVKIFAPFIKDLEDYKVSEGTAVKNDTRISLNDGIYTLVITESSPYTNKEPIICKIKVDGRLETATDEVVIRTDFDEVVTVELNEDQHKDFEFIAGEYDFSSGVGAWSTVLTINEDFSFSGKYHDSELGLTGDKYPNGTVILSEFTGKFSKPEKIDENTYKLKVESITPKYEDGYIFYENGFRYECAGEPYGFDGCREFLYYKQGRDTSDLSEDFTLGWICNYDSKSIKLPYDCIRNTQTDILFVKYTDEIDDNIETTEAQSETTTEKNNVGKFYGNETAEQLRKSIIGSWGALGSMIPEYIFYDTKNCSGEMPWQSAGTYSIGNDKSLTIGWDGKSKAETYIWSTESWDEFYSKHEYDTNFWCLRDDDVLMLNSKEKYREGVDYQKFDSSGDLMTTISGTWLLDRGKHKEYQIYSDGTWVENSVYVSGGKVITRTQLDKGNVEIVNNTTAKLWQEVNSLSQISSNTELIYDRNNDKISVGGTNNTYSRAIYQ